MSLFKTMRNVILRTPRRPREIADQHLTHSEQITHLLIQARKAHVLLNATIGQHPNHFTTALLGIYDEHDFIVLDELTPEIGHKLLQKEREIKLSGRLHGVELRFSTQLLECRKKSGIAYYKAKMPREVYYQQRRQAFRIPARGACISFHGLRGKGTHQILKGYVNDMSRKGIGLVLDDSVNLYQGEILPSCIIAIPGIGEIAFSLEVRFSIMTNNNQLVRCGGLFHDIDHASLGKIRNCINQLDRAQARRVRGT